jgi:hypothetical protein
MSWNWLEETVKLQREAYGAHPGELEGEEYALSVIENHTALVSELGEFLNEIQWKSWASKRGMIKNRDAAINELVDCGHFLANLLVGLNCTDQEWEDRYRAKMALNRKRQEDGYDGQNKCPKCKRALDDSSVTCTPTTCMYGYEAD